jgi:hypothetical protein
MFSTLLPPSRDADEVMLDTVKRIVKLNPFNSSLSTDRNQECSSNLTVPVSADRKKAFPQTTKLVKLENITESSYFPNGPTEKRKDIEEVRATEIAFCLDDFKPHNDAERTLPFSR